MANRQYAVPDGFVNETTSYEYQTQPDGAQINETVSAAAAGALPQSLIVKQAINRAANF